MGFRFSKRITILPGVRLNVGKRGASVSVGPRGASVTMGRNGTYGNVGLPGSGLSYRTRLDRPSRSSLPVGPSLPVRLLAILRNDEIVFTDENEREIDTALYSAAKREMKEEVRNLLERNVGVRNADNDTLTALHLDIPSAVTRTFSSGKPQRESYPTHEDYMGALMAWRAKSANEGPGQEVLENAILEDLGALQWPYETNISVSLQGSRVLLDVDLPEIEDMPSTRWKANLTRLTLEEKPTSQKDVAALYLGHVSSLILRLIGHSMAVSDHIRSVAVSAYTQRHSSVGCVADEYVAVVEIDRVTWNEVDCSQMRAIDPENLLRRAGAKIEANARGILKLQQPIN